MLDKIHISQDQLSRFCRKNGIRRLAAFGSILTDRFTPKSDVDLLVEFEPGRTPGLISLSGMEIELSQMIGRKVDLRTAAELSRYFRDDVLKQAEICYET